MLNFQVYIRLNVLGQLQLHKIQINYFARTWDMAQQSFYTETFKSISPRCIYAYMQLPYAIICDDGEINYKILAGALTRRMRARPKVIKYCPMAVI